MSWFAFVKGVCGLREIKPAKQKAQMALQLNKLHLCRGREKSSELGRDRGGLEKGEELGQDLELHSHAHRCSKSRERVRHSPSCPPPIHNRTWEILAPSAI